MFAFISSMIVLALCGSVYVLKPRETGPPQDSQANTGSISDKNFEQSSNNRTVTIDKPDNETYGKNDQEIITNTAKSLPETIHIADVVATRDVLNVTTHLSQPSDGRCILHIQSPGGKLVRKSAAIVKNVSGYKCNGFIVQRKELTEPGAWQLDIRHESKSGVSFSDLKLIRI